MASRPPMLRRPLQTVVRRRTALLTPQAKTHQRRPQPQQQARQMPQAVMVADAKARTAAAANPQAKSSTHGKGQTQRSDEGPMDVDVRSESMIAGKPDEARKAEATAAR